VTSGLTEAEAAARLAARPEPSEPAASRSTSAIVRANVVTPFNAILLALGLLTRVFGDWRDALFLGIIVANTGIGIWQELRAKQKLDELAALVAPRATVVRDGAPRSLHVSQVVPGDLIRLEPGDQVVADGPAREPARFDESILTGEASAVPGGGRGGAIGVVRRRASSFESGGRRRQLRRADRGDGPQFRHPRSPLELDRPAPLRPAAVVVPLGRC
jgi:hypothetical protein